MSLAMLAGVSVVNNFSWRTANSQQIITGREKLTDTKCNIV